MKMVTQTSFDHVVWIQRTFKKRECNKFIPIHGHITNRCGCGKFLTEHDEKIQLANSIGTKFLSINKDERWSTQKHTHTEPTDAFGMIEFEGMAHPTKAQYIRLSHDTRPDLVLKLFMREWNLKLPRLVISIDGGIANFELQPKLKRVLKKGLFRAAKTTGAWIITNGCQQGVVKHVGDALFAKSLKAKADIVCIGFSPWGVVEGREKLIGVNKIVSYHSMATATKNYATLNSNHYYFLLVDNGTSGKYGGEVLLRKRFERFLSRQTAAHMPGHSEHSNIPVVCVVVEGGTNTIRMVLENVTANPPVPVVVCDGSGRAADLISFTHRYAREDGTMSFEIQEQLIQTIIKTFSYSKKQAENLFIELMMCVKRRDLVTIFRMGEEPSQDIDLAILAALLRSTCALPMDQLKLALTWNRVDIARSYILSAGHQWPEQALEEIMMNALMSDKVEFCRLLLENGVYMQKFLTIKRLEELYNTRDGPPNTLKYIAKDIRKLRKSAISGYYTLPDIGLILEKLMGHGYRSNYTRRRFRTRYSTMFTQTSALQQMVYRPTMSTLAKPVDDKFMFPYNELLIWAVLTKRHQMALFFWERGEEAMAKALVAYQLNKTLAREADDDELEIEVATELANYAEQFQQLAVGVLEQCYRENDDKTCQLLTYELKNWSDWTCLSMAVIAHHQEFVAHKCCQMLLNDLWMGGMAIRRYLNWKVIASIIFFPLVLRIEFKSPEELQLQPKTHEEHLATQEDSEPEDQMSDEQLSGIVTNSAVAPGFVYDETDSKGVKEIRSKATSESSVRFSAQKNEEKNTESIELTDLSNNNTTIDRDSFPIRSSSTTPILKTNLKTTSTSMGDAIKRETSPNRMMGDFLLQNQTFLNGDSSNKRSSSSLSITERFYEFYNAPITKFWYNAIFFLFFLLFFTYMVLVRTPPRPSIPEYIVTIYLASLALDQVREIIFSSSPRFTRRLTLYFSNFVHICDCLALLAYGLAFILRFHTRTRQFARLLYCLDVSYWWLHLLTYISINKYVGPYIHIAAQNSIDLFNFIIIILVVLVSFGVSRQAIKFPNELWSWRSVKEIFLEPYFMIYGEVYAGSIDPPCTEIEPDAPQCMPFHWVTPITMTAFLIFCNILLLSILIATFNNTYIRISKSSDQVWKYHRYSIVLKYESKPMLPPPFILVSHLLLLMKIIYRYGRGKKFKVDHGLKLFLSEKEVAEIHDFEEEQIDEYFAMKDREKKNTTAEQIAVTADRVDMTALRVDDIYQRETQNRVVLQNLDWRLQRLEDLNISMYRMMQTMTGGQESVDRRPSFWFDDDTNSRRPSSSSRRRSSISPYGIHRFEQNNLLTSSSNIYSSATTNRMGMMPQLLVERRPSTPDRISISKSPSTVNESSSNANRLIRQSTIKRLNSSTSSEPANIKIQSNEYTSITDVIDTTSNDWQPPSPVVGRTRQSSSINDNIIPIFEPTNETDETTAHDAEEATHNLIGEIIRKRARKMSFNPAADAPVAAIDTTSNISHNKSPTLQSTLAFTDAPTEFHCDSDHVSLLSMDISCTTSNPSLYTPDAPM